jgi:choline monooxygenase
VGVEPWYVDDDIRRAETLPAAAFTDRAFLDRELATVFARAWQLVPEPAGRGDAERPLVEQLAPRGARVPFSLLGRPLFAQRGWDDDALRVLPNTCTHAWYPLVPGPSRGPTLVCGQHGRRFDCAGRFVSQPGFGKDVPDFPRACDHLAALPARPWRGWLFTRLGAGDRDLDATLAEVDASLVRYPDELQPAASPGEVREVAGNWKLHAWNYLDRFHIAYIHRPPGGLADACDLATYTTELYDDAVLQWVYARDPADGLDPALLPERFRDPSGRRVFALWWFVWPNLTLNFYPWGLSVNVYQPVPDRPDATRFLWYHRVRDPALHAERDRRWLSAQVDAEDVDALAQVRAGLRSGFAPRGRFAPDDEQAAHWFHRRVSREVMDG